MAFRQFSPEGYLGPADGFHKYGTGPSPEYSSSDYEQQQTTNPSALPRTLPGSGRGLADLLKGLPRGSRFYDYGTGENRGAKGLYPSLTPMGVITPRGGGEGLEPKSFENMNPFMGQRLNDKTYEFMDDFRDSSFYKDAGNYSGMSTMDQRYNPFTGKYGGSSDFNRYKHAYDKFLTERSKPADFDENQALPEPQPFQPTTMKPGPPSPQPSSPQIDISKYRNLFNQNRFRQPQPFMGQGFNPFMGGFGRSTRSPMMGGFGGFGGYGRSPMMGGYGSPFGGLGMFGMSPYGGMPNYGMFGGMMSPYMGGMGGMFGGGGRGQFPQQPQRPAVDRSTFVTDPTLYYKGDASTPNFQPNMGSQSTQQPPNMNNQPTQQPFQSPNPFMNPFMSGLGSMMGSMFGGGYGSNVSNTQANVAQ